MVGNAHEPQGVVDNRDSHALMGFRAPGSVDRIAAKGDPTVDPRNSSVEPDASIE